MTRRTLLPVVGAIIASMVAGASFRAASASGAAPVIEGAMTLHVERVRVSDGSRRVIASFDTLVIAGARFSWDASIEGRTIHLDGMASAPKGGQIRAQIHFSDGAAGHVMDGSSNLILELDEPAQITGLSKPDAPSDSVSVTLTERGN